MKKLANIDIGLCGEYYVCAQMHLKGWTASMTLKNYPGIDILGYNPTENKRTEINLKFISTFWQHLEYSLYLFTFSLGQH